MLNQIKDVEYTEQEEADFLDQLCEYGTHITSFSSDGCDDCPKCGKLALTYFQYDNTTDQAFRDVACTECDFYWSSDQQEVAA